MIGARHVIAIRIKNPALRVCIVHRVGFWWFRLQIKQLDHNFVNKTKFLTLGMMYSISDTCSWEPFDFFLLVFGTACIEQNASWQSTKDNTTATVVARRVAKQAGIELNNLTGSAKVLNWFTVGYEGMIGMIHD